MIGVIHHKWWSSVHVLCMRSCGQHEWWQVHSWMADIGLHLFMSTF